MRRPTTPILLVALLGGFTLLFFHHVVAGGVLVHIDFHQTFEPQQRCVLESVARGSALWNPQLSNGGPLLADPIYAAFYPPRWLITPFEPAVGLTLLAVAHVFWGALGALLLARAWRLGSAPSLVAGLVFGFSGLAVSATAPCAYGWTLAWEPWLLLAFEGVLRSPRRSRAILGLALATFLILVAGEPFVIVGALLGMAFRLVLAFPDDAVAPRRRAFLLALPALLLGAAGALPHILASSRMFASTVRASGFTTEGVLQWSLHPLELVGLAISDPFGDPTTYGELAFWAQRLVEPRTHFLFQGNYVGALVVVLALVGLTHRGRLRVALAAWLGTLLLMALGRFGPVYPLLIAIDEAMVSSIRYPTKWLVPAMLPLALLAAAGVARIGSGFHLHRPLLVALLGLAGLALVSASLPLGLDRWLAGLSGKDPALLAPAAQDLLLRRVTLAALPLLLMALALLAAIRGALDRRRLAAVLALLVAADLWVNNRHLAPTVPRPFYRDVPAAARAILADGAACRVLPIDVDARAPAPPGGIGDIRDYFRWERQSLRLLTAASYGLSLAFNPDMEAFSTLRYTQLGVLVRGAPLREQLMLAGAAGVTHIVSQRPIDSPLLTPVELPEAAPVLVLRNRLAQPRVRIVGRVVPYRDFDGLIRLVRGAPDALFSDSALVEASAPASIPPVTVAAPADAEIVADTGSRLVVRTRGGGGYLVVSDTHTPGWHATVDNEDAPIFVADVAFRGIVVPSGDHEVVFSYNPWR